MHHLILFSEIDDFHESLETADTTGFSLNQIHGEAPTNDSLVDLRSYETAYRSDRYILSVQD